MGLTVVQGSSNPALAARVLAELGVEAAACRTQRYPDGELGVEVLGNARGHDVYFLQPTHPPVGEHLLELLLLADSYRRAGASRLTAVVPYLGYARQDRRSTGRESLGARLVADLFAAVRLDRVVAVDLHAAAVEGCFSFPLEHLTGVPLLASAARPRAGVAAVVVSPDMGAVKLAERYAELLDLPMAVVHKTRLSGAEVAAHGVVGEVRGRAPLIVDDMVTTAGTVEAAARAVLDAGALPQVTVAATHALLVGPALARLSALPGCRLVASDSVPAPEKTPPFELVRCSLGPLLAETIRRLHHGQSLVDLVARR